GVGNTGNGHGVVFADVDNDGDLDLYTINFGTANILYRNNGNGTFTDITGAAGLGDTGNGRGNVFGDIDGDNDLDLYITNDGTANILYRNNGNGTFTDITGAAGVGNTGSGYGTTFGDVDNDGDLDLYVVNVGANILYLNNGNGTFTDITGTAGVGDTGNDRGSMFSDIDGDGDLDLYLIKWGGANVLYRNNGNGTFTDIAGTAGVGDTGNGYGTAFGDVDADGDLDLYITNYGQANVLYRNDANPSASTWLAADLQGPVSGVTVHLYDGATRIATRTVDGGSGYASQNATPIHFYALDSATSYNLRFTMPDGTAYDLAMGTPDGTVHKVILGSSGADTRTGLSAGDYLFGLGGNDTLNGGAGADTLTGGTGADVFTFSNLIHSTNTSADRIADFENGTDTINLTGLGFTTLSDFENLSYNGTITTLHDTDTNFAITFTGDVTGLLDNSDFIF
ncbi:MAG: VCBS repeat-containing protein, partial [Caldilineaceae bacterium]|nr:VCBS repeat-containing protein [Caldilineaceae bacterium]